MTDFVKHLIAREDSETNLFYYVPSRAINIVALVFFVIAFIGHTGLAIKFKQRWFGICFFIGVGLEVIGYIGRAMGSNNPYSRMAYIIQTTCLTFAPAFMMAGIYYLLALVVVIWGYEYSYFQPWTYSRMFIGMDIFAILMQSSGGAIAATASGDGGNTTLGTHVMVAGLALQVVSTIFVGVASALYYHRLRTNQPWSHTINKSRASYGSVRDSEKAAVFDRDHAVHLRTRMSVIRNTRWAKVTILMSILATVLIFVRSIYRVVELGEGWAGTLMVTEVYFLSMDTLLVGVAVWLLMVFYPGWALGGVQISEGHRASVMEL
ncbi:RTA1 like protein-domain-containing protein [Dipodascopsis tothii]|uniref:RTA1 like protein-domain-containing protein n=1 Tax=Dipodascopsis tothii TaxID=44089 RepID=UPI0034CEEF94